MTGSGTDTSRDIKRAAEGYGAVFYGGNPADREQALRERLDGPFLEIDGTETFSSDHLDIVRGPGSEDSLLVLEFDSMPEDVQTRVAQMVKGLAERRDYEGEIGFTSVEPDAVVRSEPDLSMRVRSFEVGEEVLPQ